MPRCDVSLQMCMMMEGLGLGLPGQDRTAGGLIR